MNRKAINMAKEAHALIGRIDPPFNPFWIASQLVIKRAEGDGSTKKINIKHQPLNAENAKTLSAQVYFDQERDAFVCEYHPDEIIYRQNFAMAFSLGHVLLGHVNKPGSEITASVFSDKGSEEDAAACDFALALLMPEFWMRTFFPVIKQVQDLSEAFVVSNAAASLRLRQLRLI